MQVSAIDCHSCQGIESTSFAERCFLWCSSLIFQVFCTGLGEINSHRIPGMQSRQQYSAELGERVRERALLYKRVTKPVVVAGQCMRA